MEYLILMADFEWVNQKNAFIVALVIAVAALVRFILLQTKIIKSKDAIIFDIATESIAAIKVVEAKSITNTAEHKSIVDQIGKLDGKLNNILNKVS